MEIRIKTHDEARSNRVTIEIDGVGPIRYTDEDVARAQLSEAQLVADPLKRRIEELERGVERQELEVKALEDSLRIISDHRDRLGAALADMTAKRDEAEKLREIANRQRDNAQVVARTMAEERDAERERANENKEWAEHADERLGQAELKLHKIKKMFRDSAILRDISSILANPEGYGRDTVVLAVAVGDIRRILDLENPDGVTVE